MDLHQSRTFGNKRRHNWDLERSGRGDHIGRFDRAVRGFDPKSSSADEPLDLLNLDPAADRGLNHVRVVDEIIGYLLLGHEAVGIGIGKGHARKTVMPSWTVGH